MGIEGSFHPGNNSPANWKTITEEKSLKVVNRISRLIERVNLEAADRIMVVSDVLGQFLVSRGIDARKVIVNPNGADASYSTPDVAPGPVRQRLKLNGKIVVGFAGNHNSNNTWHGTKHLAMAVPAASNAWYGCGSFFYFVMRGLSTWCSQSRRLTAYTLGGDFCEGSAVPGDAGYYAACDILVSPHVNMADGTTFFGLPVKIFEYMAMGKAIVASGVGQLAVLLRDHDNALLTTPGDSERYRSCHSDAGG